MKDMQRNMLSQLVSDQIKQYIADKGLAPGDKLPTERDLAEVLEVSRTVVREALNQLETLGMINKIQGKGIFIAEQNLSKFFQEIVSGWENTTKSVQQLIDFRILLETAALEQIVLNAEDADYAELELIIDRSRDSAVTLEEFINLDYEFHRKLLQLTKNDLYYQLITITNDYFKMLRLKLHAIGQTTVQREPTIRDHQQLLHLLRVQQVDEAKALLQNHLKVES